MYLKLTLKYSIPVFLLLAIYISLFPPFQWGGDKIKTHNERENFEYSDLLPIKEYDFLFSGNKKLFKVGKYKVSKKVYEKDLKSLDFLDDAYGYKIKDVKDTITTLKDIAYKMDDSEKSKILRLEIKYKLNWREFSVKNADNYWEIQNEFEKSPESWNTRTVKAIVKIDEYKLYTIIKPHYYLLGREIILSELFVNYLLGVFFSIAICIIIIKIKTK
jgi:hypothetical protein